MAMTARRFASFGTGPSGDFWIHGLCVGENYGAGTLPKRIENGNEDLNAIVPNRPVPLGLRGGLASAKHWYSGRIDPRKNHSVLSKIRRGVAKPSAVRNGNAKRSVSLIA